MNILIFNKKANVEEIKQISEHFAGYIKVVVDIETGEIDYNSMINLRPKQDNPSRDILSIEVRKKFDEVVNKILK